MKFKRGYWVLGILVLFLSGAAYKLESQNIERSAKSAPDGLSRAPSSQSGTQSFERRCAHPDAVRCYGFDDPADLESRTYPPSNTKVKRATFDGTVKASGAGSLRFEVPGNTGADSSGSFAINFSPGTANTISARGQGINYPVQFGPGDDFYIQWRQRMSPAMLTRWPGGGWKTFIVGTGDTARSIAYTCTDLEVVINNGQYRGFPQMYHSCGKKDGAYEGMEIRVPQPNPLGIPSYAYNIQPRTPQDFLIDPPCLHSPPYGDQCRGKWKPDQWMTFQVHVKVGTWYRNDRIYCNDPSRGGIDIACSTIELWVAEEGQASQLVLRRTGYDLYGDSVQKYGKLWFLPYDTGKTPDPAHPTGFMWFDELVISRSKIADP